MASAPTVTPAATLNASMSAPTRTSWGNESMRGAHHQAGSSQHRNTSRGGKRGRARGNRGGRFDGNNSQHPRGAFIPGNRPTPPRPPPSLDSVGVFGSPTEDAETKEALGKGKQQETLDEDVEAEVCFICASPVVYTSLAPCNHRTCHICALRLRALYKTRACAHCRTEAKFVIFTDNTIKRYEDFVDADFQETDETLGIKYEQKEIHADTILLLRYNCPDQSCDVACYGWPDLHRHVKNAHHKAMCDLCTRNKKVFTHEHELFTVQELRKHEKFGDDHPGAVDQSGFKGHPECGFCRQRFYGDDELYTHCRDKHERCHICDRREQGSQHQYYIDYESLEQHFKSDHFLCSDQDCLDKKFVVFESEMDLKAHQLESHPNGLTKDARRDARRVDISSFDYRTPHQDNRRARGERSDRGRGRGRDPNAESLPPSSAQPMRRDEIAYQRQMAIQSAQSVTSRVFGGQLTSTDPPRPRPQDHPRQPSPALPPIENLQVNSATPPQPMTAQQQARQLQHTAVVDRAATMLKNDQSKIADFRKSVSSYRNSMITASQLIDTFFSLFDVASPDLGKLIKELADIYEDESKRNNLLKAWNDWRAINEDYPSLPGPSGVLPGSSTAAAGSGGTRVLKLKSSTAQSSRSAVSKQRSWGNTTNSNPSNSNPFPPMTAASTSRALNPVPWVTASMKPSPAPSRPASRPQPTGRVNDAVESFPALPAAAKPNLVGLARGTVRWDDGRTIIPANAWGSANSTGTSVVDDADPELDLEGTAEHKKKKGGKNKKQTLYKFG